MRRRHHGITALIGLTGLAASLFTVISGTAADAARAWSAHVCVGTAKKPGTLAGTHANVVVRGVCAVDHGPAIVKNDLIIARHGALLAVFAHGHSRLWVGRDIIVKRGGSLIMGCESKRLHGRPIFPCADDPNQAHPTLSSHDVVRGDLIEAHPLGVVVHNSSIYGNVKEIGGGGGLNCKPSGIFVTFKSPVYSDYEDNWIRGSVWIRYLRSCWLGAIRNWIGGSITVSRNLMADPDAMEVTTNVVLHDLTCYRNSPAVQFGDGHGLPNRVGLHAFFECGFHVLLPDPAGQHKHFAHISVHLH